MQVQLPPFGEIIRFHRKKIGISQAELARLAGIGKAAVFDVEHGTKSSRLDTVAKIFAVLNISMHLESPLMASFRREEEGLSDATGKSVRP
jgi:transcriptional regulator with XRE-family HTH domain